MFYVPICGRVQMDNWKRKHYLVHVQMCVLMNKLLFFKTLWKKDLRKENEGFIVITEKNLEWNKIYINVKLNVQAFMSMHVNIHTHMYKMICL